MTGMLLRVLRENNLSQFLPLRTQYDYLWKAATQFVKRARCMSENQVITTVASQATYDQNPDFLQFNLMDTYNRYFVTYFDGTNTNNVYFRDYSMVVYQNVTQPVPLPFNFTNNDKQGPVTNITGTAANTSNVLTDATAPFTNSAGVQLVFPGDIVHDTTSGAYGLVTQFQSSTSVVTALFDASTGSTVETWTAGDGYVIVPQGRKQLILNPPPLASGCTVTIPSYIRRPSPVYTPYDSYAIDSQYALALVYYACWLAKYQDEEPQLGDSFYKYWDAQVREGVRDQQKGLNRIGYRVNMVKRSYDDRSYR